MRRTLRDGFLRSCERFGDRPALVTPDAALSYRELFESAARIAASLVRETKRLAGGPAARLAGEPAARLAGEPGGPDSERAPALTAVFAHRTTTAFAGVLGALFRGHGYVPINRTFPVERSREMLARSGCEAMVVDARSEAQLEAVLAGNEQVRVIILPDRDDVSELREHWPGRVLLGAGDLASASEWSPPSREDPNLDELAYLLFTSGSTGHPKGVQVRQSNVLSFVDAMVDAYEIDEHDRLSQTFAMTFDLSAFDMFVAWERGAALCCPTDRSLIKPGRYIRSSKLSVWFAVPSTAGFMQRLGELKPDAYPDLRLVLFCGEPLPVESVESWASAAPNAEIENLYGPTELTIACTRYRVDRSDLHRESERGLVPIGWPYPEMRHQIVDRELLPVPQGEPGELIMTGPQLTPGYWRDPEKTAAAFVRPPDRQDLYYRTGDLVRQRSPDSPIVYLGRLDHQLQILGHRVELGEIESVLREEAGVTNAVAVGHPVTPSGASGVVAFLDPSDVETNALRTRLRSRLPEYMVPRELRTVARFPLNANGKIDRGQLLASLDAPSEELTTAATRSVTRAHREPSSLDLTGKIP